MAISLINLYVNHRLLDRAFMFLIVWYYCTLTIRESILRVNGSKIKVIRVVQEVFIHKAIKKTSDSKFLPV